MDPGLHGNRDDGCGGFLHKTYPRPKNLPHTFPTCEMHDHRTYANGMMFHKQRSGGGHIRSGAGCLKAVDVSLARTKLWGEKRLGLQEAEVGGLRIEISKRCWLGVCLRTLTNNIKSPHGT